MSDEESFVILGTSPMPSLEVDGTTNGKCSSTLSSIQSDTPGSRFTSLKSSQINELQNAQENSPQTSEIEIQTTKETKHHQAQMAEIEIKPQFEKQQTQLDVSSMIKSIERPGTSDSNIRKQTINVNRNIQPEMGESIKIKHIKSKESLNQLSEPENPDIKLWSRQPNVNIEENEIPFSLEEFVIKSPLEKQQQQQEEPTEAIKTKMTSSTQTNSSEESKVGVAGCSKKTPPTSVNSNLAASFILGEVDADILKTSVYSQFPSISMEASPEEVMKLQNMVFEYNELKNTIKNANTTMKQLYEKYFNWKQKLDTNEEHYKQQLDKCLREIEMLHKQNEDLEKSFKAQIEAIEIARKKDHDETIKIISEKNALLENLKAQIIKLEKQQLASFEFVLQNQDEEESEYFKKFFITRREHDAKIKSLERQLSELLAKNLDLNDLEKQYVDEINCLKVNLTAAEELIKENKANITNLQKQDFEKQQQIVYLENRLKELSAENEEQRERITLLEHQTEVHRKDFTMERESRELALKEKQQILQDLRNLQRRNQELLEEHSKLAQTYERRLMTVGLGNNVTQITANTPASNSYSNNPQRPIRALPTSSPSAPAGATAGSPGLMHFCPICNKAFKSLNILQSHVNDCIDRS